MIQREQLDSLMRSWLTEESLDGPDTRRALAVALERTRSVSPRPEWLVRVRRAGIGRPRARSATRFQALAVIVVVATLLVALTLAVSTIGSRLPDRSAIGLTATATIPAATTTPSADARLTPSASPAATTVAPMPSSSPPVLPAPRATDHGVFTSAGTDLLGGAATPLQVQLPDGRILIAGFGGPDHSAIEIYDPERGTFAANGHLLVRRDLGTGTAVALADGRVLFEGGSGIVRSGSKSSWGGLSSAELYDPATGTSTPTGPMTTPRSRGSATRLLDGRVLIAGGDPAGSDLPWGPGSNLAEIYDPATGEFTSIAPMHRARFNPGAALLPDGRVLVVGGVGHSDGVPTAEVYDPAADTWTMTGSLHPNGESYFNEPRVVVQLRDGRVVVVEGGADSSLQVPFDTEHRLPKPAVSTVIEAYDPVQNAFTELGSTRTGRIAASVTVLNDGRLLIAGGLTTPFLGTLGTRCCIWELDPDASAEVFDPATNLSVATGSMRGWRAGQAAFLLPDGDAFLFGGNSGHRAELFHP